MELQAPTRTIFGISIAIAAIGFLGNFIPALTDSAVWIILIAFITLMFGTLVKGK